MTKMIASGEATARVLQPSFCLCHNGLLSVNVTFILLGEKSNGMVIMGMILFTPIVGKSTAPLFWHPKLGGRVCACL